MVEELHILHVVGAMDIGGIENMLMTLMPHMREKGIIFDFAVHSNAIGVHEPKIKELGGKIYRLPKFVGINVFAYLKVWRKLLASHPELKVIHGHMTSTASIYLWMARRYARITIAHSHSTAVSGGKTICAIKRILEYPLPYISDYLCACSVDAADYRFGLGASKCRNFFLWHNAIDTGKFRFSQKKREELRKKLGIGDTSVVIGHVGRMIPVKNHKFLLQVFQEYRRINSDCKLLLIGDGGERNTLEVETKKMGIANDTIFIGSITNPADYLSVMDVFCLPSLNEGLSVALIEAQINERLCISSDVVPREVMISDNVKFLPLSYGAKKWALHVNDFLGKKEKIQSNMLNVYDVHMVSDEVNKFYRKISAGS